MFIENKIKSKLSKPGTICGTQQQQELYYTPIASQKCTLFARTGRYS